MGVHPGRTTLTQARRSLARPYESVRRGGKRCLHWGVHNAETGEQERSLRWELCFRIRDGVLLSSGTTTVEPTKVRKAN